MKVTLISHTPDAMDLLIFTKSTRLSMHPGLMDEIRAWPMEKKLEELAYMANTIPSSWEFVDYVFMIEGVSRAFTHQFVRSRTGSYAQQTMRMLDMGSYDYVYTDANLSDPVVMMKIKDVNDSISEAYCALREWGQKPEDARGILPTNIATNIVAKFNLRSLSDLVKSRTGGRTQGEYQKVAQAMADAVLAVHPWAEQFLFPHTRSYFDDIEEFASILSYSFKSQLLKIVDKMRKEV